MSFSKKTSDEVLEVIRNLPDCKSEEIQQLVSHASPSVIRQILSSLYQQGVIIRHTIKRGAGEGRSPYFYRINPNPDQPPPPPVQRKVTQPTEAGLQAQVEALKARVAELEAWRADAIARFPDLDVDPVVLEARKIVAKELRDGGDSVMAEQVLAGHKDTTLPMRATVAALSRS